MNDLVDISVKGTKIFNLLKIGDPDNDLLSDLKTRLESELKDIIDEVRILPDFFPMPKVSYDKIRRQYLASSIIDEISRDFRSKDYFYTIAITDQDIYEKNINDLFGLTNSSVCLVSILRLSPSWNQEAKDDEVMINRAIKAILNLTSMPFGLSYCINECVNQFSTRVSDLDAKSINYCKFCYKELKRMIKENYGIYKKQEEIINLLSKRQDRIRFDSLRELLDFKDKKEFHNQIFEWAKKYQFKINGEYLVFKIDSIDPFFMKLNDLYQIWNINNEQDKNWD